MFEEVSFGVHRLTLMRPPTCSFREEVGRELRKASDFVRKALVLVIEWSCSMCQEGRSILIAEGDVTSEVLSSSVPAVDRG